MSEWKLDAFRAFSPNDPVSEAALAEFLSASKFQLPTDYLDFAQRMNRGEGFVGELFIRLFRVEELLKMNIGYSFQEFFPGFFLFGSDGGGEAFAFRTSEDNAVYRLPFVGLPEDAVKITGSFAEWLEQITNNSAKPQ